MALTGMRVVVVGGTSGIGLAVAHGALAAGARVVVVGRDPVRAEAAATALGSGAAAEIADALDEISIAGCFARIGKFDHLVTTTGRPLSTTGANRSAVDMPLDKARGLFESKFWSQYTAAKHAVAKLSDRGSIVMTSGVASRRAMANHTVLAAVNAGIDAVARQMAKEIGPRRVNVVSPGLAATLIGGRPHDDARRAMLDDFAKRLPVAHVGTPDEVAAAYLFCMTASYVTGAVIDIDGGFLSS